MIRSQPERGGILRRPAGHFAFADEQGIDWTELRADCDAALRRGPAISGAPVRHAGRSPCGLEGRSRIAEGHGALRGKPPLGRCSFIEPGRPPEGGRSMATSRTVSAVTGSTMSSAASCQGTGHLAARDTVAWGRLPDGLGYISLLACESLSEDEGGHADVLAARQVFDRALKDLADARGLIVDLRCNYGGWDRVPLTLASHLTDSTVRAFTKQPVRHGVGLQVQTDRADPGPGPPVYRPCGGSDQRCHPQRRGGRNAGAPRPAEHPLVRPSDLWRAVRSLPFPPAERLEGGCVERDLSGMGRRMSTKVRAFPPTNSPPSRRRGTSGDRWTLKPRMPKHGCWHSERGEGASSHERMLLTTTAAIACLMLTPSVEARQHSRQDAGGRQRRSRSMEPAIRLSP